MTHIKIAPLQVKAAGPDDGLEDGQFEAYASVFGNVDSYGDIVEKGAFGRSLAEWTEKGDPIPLLWGHDMHDPFSNIGHIVKAVEDDHGLKVTGQFDVQNAKAAQVYRLVKGRRVTDLSFAYDIKDAENAEDGYHLKDLDLFEVSIVPVGANRATDVLAVKATAQALDAGLLRKDHIDSLREAQETLGTLIKAIEGDDQENEASGDAEAKSGASDEEPSGAKSSVPDEEPKSSPSVDSFLASISIAERSLG